MQWVACYRWGWRQGGLAGKSIFEQGLGGLDNQFFAQGRGGCAGISGLFWELGGAGRNKSSPKHTVSQGEEDLVVNCTVMCGP